MNPRRLAARIIEQARDFPTAVGPGERALVVEVGIVREQLASETRAANTWRESAFRWRERCIAVRLELAQVEGELAMAQALLAGYQAIQTPPSLPRPVPQPRPADGDTRPGTPGRVKLVASPLVGRSQADLTRPGVAQDEPAERG